MSEIKTALFMEKKKITVKQEKTIHDEFFEATMKFEDVARSLFEKQLDPEALSALDLDTMIFVEPLEEEKDCPYGAVTHQCYLKNSQEVAYLHAVHGDPNKDPYMVVYMQNHIALLMKHYLDQGHDKLPAVLTIVVNSGH